MFKKKIEELLKSPKAKALMHKEMDRRERELEMIAKEYFGEDMVIMYVPKEGLKKGILVVKERRSKK